MTDTPNTTTTTDTTTDVPQTRSGMIRSKRDQEQRKVKIWLDQESEANLRSSQEMYEAILSRRVTATLAIRRGLDLLAAHLSDLDDKAAVEAEKARLFNFIR
jgi:hypothetical protein